MSQSDNSKQASAGTGNASATQVPQLQVNVQLQPVGDSQQPIFSNFATAQGGSGLVFIDFGFFDPGALPAVARLAQSGGKVPEVVNGRLACRVALSLDATIQLAQQLDQLLRGLQARAQQSGGVKNTQSSS